MSKVTDNNLAMKIYIAHSENEKGDIQTMKHHSLGVAQIMKNFAMSEDFIDLYIFCGMIHDMGKYSNDFQLYIAGADIKPKHSIYGALFAIRS